MIQFQLNHHLTPSHLGVVQALPEGEAGTIVTVRVDVSQNRYEEGGRQLIGNQLPTAGLAELKSREEGRRGGKVVAILGQEVKTQRRRER